MPWGKSDDDKQAKAAEKQREASERQAAKDREAYLRTPIGQAEEALQRGDRFFQVEIPISALRGPASSFGSSTNQLRRSRNNAPDILGQIEELGWRLEHVGYVFIETGSTSTNRVLSTGQGTVTRGQVQGIYLFRANRPGEPQLA